eukprot:jgi/Picre1/31019/NNA_006377.t1
MGSITDKQLARVEQQYKVYEAMINSMTKQERASQNSWQKALQKTASSKRVWQRRVRCCGISWVFTGMKAQMQTMSRMMAISGGASGLMGMPGMDDEEMMSLSWVELDLGQ